MADPARYHYSIFPPQNLNWTSIIPYIGPASSAIARYDGLLNAIPNAELFLTPLTTQEAVLSSKIEGTQATMGDVLEYEVTGDNDQYDAAKKADINEILNYRQAMREAEAKLNELPLSLRLIKELHQTLLSGVRGKNKAPGEFRKTQNWIGAPGCSMETATYVPISADKLIDALSIWEKFIHAQFSDILVQLALLHVEFEQLHPFLDGNGRIGRIFIPLFLWQKGIISRPSFYISAILENNRETYYHSLLEISKSGKWTEWCIFFLWAIKKQAEDNFNKAKAILNLYDKMKKVVPEITNHKYAVQTIDWIFQFPVFSSSGFKNKAGIPPTTAARILATLVNSKIVTQLEITNGTRSTTYSFQNLLNIVERN